MFAFDTAFFDGFVTNRKTRLFPQALETYLFEQASVYAYPGHVPQKKTSYPVLVYSQKPRSSFNTLDGPTKLVKVDYELKAIGTSKAAAESLGETIRGVLQSYRGSFGGLILTGCRLINRSTGYASTAWGSDQGTYTIPYTYLFWYIRP
jgi:hypothetical protein